MNKGHFLKKKQRRLGFFRVHCLKAYRGLLVDDENMKQNKKKKIIIIIIIKKNKKYRVCKSKKNAKGLFVAVSYHKIRNAPGI
jgi:hypothetical protein